VDLNLHVCHRSVESVTRPVCYLNRRCCCAVRNNTSSLHATTLHTALYPHVQVDPDNDGPGLPTADTDEFRPFTRRLPEFQFWHSSVRGVLIAFCMTFFGLFDVPVFWPILLVYFLVLFFLTMKRQIKHMIKHRCVAYIYIVIDY
jgi:Rer1 family